MEADFNGLTIIQDHFDGSGQYLLAAYAKKFQKRNYRFVCLVDDANTESLLETVLGGNNFTVIRLNDPLGWDSDEGGILRNADSLLETICRRLKETTSIDTVILLPSLTWIWITFGHSEAFRFLVRLRSWKGVNEGVSLPVIGLMNGELLTSLQSDQWKYLSTTWMEVVARDKTIDGGVCRIRVKWTQKKGRKLNEKVYNVDITTSFDCALSSLPTTQPIIEPIDQPNQPDPTAGLTFSMRLKDTETTARRSVQLPHIVVRDSIKKLIRSEDHSSSMNRSSQIIYTPDEADDFDDEDPDADLDI